MRISESMQSLGLSLLLVAGLTACNKPGPAETAGEKMDRSVDEAGRKMGDAVDKTGDYMSEKADQAGVAMNDAEITTLVKSAIYSEPGLNTLKISVDTVKGVVTLSGSVESQSSFDGARTLAESVAGVKEVENHLKVVPAR